MLSEVQVVLLDRTSIILPSVVPRAHRQGDRRDDDDQRDDAYGHGCLIQ